MFDGAPELSDRLVDHEAEAHVLGMLIGRPRNIEALPASFADDVFHHPDHREIFRLIRLDASTASERFVQQQWARDDDRRRYIARVIASPVSYERDRVVDMAGMVADLARRRAFRAAARNAAEKAEHLEVSLADTVSTSMLAADAIATGQDEAATVTLGDAAALAIQASQRARDAGGLLGQSTGFSALDELIGGLEPGRLYVLGARPSMGKSAIGAQMALHAARTGTSTLLVSLEMSAMQLGQRALADVADVFLSSIARGRYSSQQADRIVAAQRELTAVPLKIRDIAAQRVDEIARQARAAARSRAGLGLLVLDHLHITELPPEAGRLGATWGVGQVSRGLKRLAKDLGIPVLALAQLNRGLESREDKRPTLADLRQSGDIEQDADTVMFLHRPEYYLPPSPPERAGRSAEKHAEAVAVYQATAEAAAGRAELIVAKNRDGALGTVHLHFDAPRTRFIDGEDRP